MPQHKPEFDTINLGGKDDVTKAIPVGDATKISVGIIADTVVYTDTSWTVDLEWSLAIGVDEQRRSVEDWRAFATAVQFTSTTPARRKKSVTGAGYLRLRTSTAGTTKPDPHARVVWVRR